jgi:hypothetical protein
MTASNLKVDQWTETAFVEIADNSATSNIIQFGTITDTIDIAIGSRDVEAIAMVSAGRVTKFTPEDITEITLELYPIGTSSVFTTATVGATGSNPNGVLSWFWGLSPNTKVSRNAFGRKKFRLSLLWTDTVTDVSAAVPVVSAQSTTVGSYLRLGFWNAYMTDAKMDFTDDILKQTVTFKCIPFDRTAAGMITIEEYYVDGTDVTKMPAMSTFNAGVGPTNPNTWT